MYEIEDKDKQFKDSLTQNYECIHLKSYFEMDTKLFLQMFVRQYRVKHVFFQFTMEALHGKGQLLNK